MRNKNDRTYVELMIFDDKEKCLQLAEKIILYYRRSLGTECKLKLLQLSENITYLVEHTESADRIGGRAFAGRRERAIVRLCRPAYHSPEELQSEIDWMLQLRKDLEEQKREEAACRNNFFFNLRQPIAGDDGRYLHAVEDQGEKVYYGVVFTYMPGTPLEDVPLDKQLIWFERLGEVTALLHSQVQNWQGASKLSRFHWNYESMIGQRAVWGDWRSVFVSEETERSLQEIPDVLYCADRIIYDKLQNYGMTERNYGLIHGDLRGANLLLEDDGLNEGLNIIDFDDCGFGWYMQDLAASLSFIETEEIVPKLIQAWIAGYRKRGILTQTDLDMISTFIMMRRLQLLAWVHSRTNAVSAIAYRERFAEGTVELAEKYVASHL